MLTEFPNTSKQIWQYLSNKQLNNYAIAGLIGNMYCESSLNPQNLQNSYNKSLKVSDEAYTQAVDRGKYTKFATDKAGYGLCQWTNSSRKQNLLDYAKQQSASVGDLNTQLDFLYNELSHSYLSVLKALQTVTSVKEASDIILTKFERPANQTEENKKFRADICKQFYNKFAEKEHNTKMVDKIKDNTPDPWAKEAVEWAVENHILYGDNNGDYKLHKDCTRQEMIVFLDRVRKLNGGK